MRKRKKEKWREGGLKTDKEGMRKERELVTLYD